MVCKVSRKLCKWKYFQAMLLTVSLIQGEKAPQLNPNWPGVNGVAGVMKGKLIFSKHLLIRVWNRVWKYIKKAPEVNRDPEVYIYIYTHVCKQVYGGWFSFLHSLPFGELSVCVFFGGMFFYQIIYIDIVFKILYSSSCPQSIYPQAKGYWK